jgi:hypothetical protein
MLYVLLATLAMIVVEIAVLYPSWSQLKWGSIISDYTTTRDVRCLFFFGNSLLHYSFTFHQCMKREYITEGKIDHLGENIIGAAVGTGTTLLERLTELI